MTVDFSGLILLNDALQFASVFLSQASLSRVSGAFVPFSGGSGQGASTKTSSAHALMDKC